ncbi:hypothetical protein K3495_g4732 [Podosphaera aphanis]|nr:hypothetical protein K3495_g4732 [Podosphaera aphanis]
MPPVVRATRLPLDEPRPRATLDADVQRPPPYIRQADDDASSFYIPTTYNEIDDGPTPGTVAGIVLGAVGGLLVLFWLLYMYIYLSPGFARPAPAFTYSGARERPRSTPRPSYPSARSRVLSEKSSRVRRSTPTSKSTRSGAMPVSKYLRTMPPRQSRSVTNSTRTTPKKQNSRRRTYPPSPSQSPSFGSTRSDEVVVIEEYSPPPRKKSTRRVSRESRREERRN